MLQVSVRGSSECVCAGGHGQAGMKKSFAINRRKNVKPSSVWHFRYQGFGHWLSSTRMCTSYTKVESTRVLQLYRQKDYSRTWIGPMVQSSRLRTGRRIGGPRLHKLTTPRLSLFFYDFSFVRQVAPLKQVLDGTCFIQMLDENSRHGWKVSCEWMKNGRGGWYFGEFFFCYLVPISPIRKRISPLYKISPARKIKKGMLRLVCKRKATLHLSCMFPRDWLNLLKTLEGTGSSAILKRSWRESSVHVARLSVAELLPCTRKPTLHSRWFIAGVVVVLFY